MPFIGRKFISMRVKFVAAALITGITVVTVAAVALFLILELGNPTHPILIVALGVLSAICTFLLVMLIYHHLQIRAIVQLSAEVEAVSMGRLEEAISLRRHDEIGQLAADVNRLRETILEKVAQKEAAWQANSDLLTSMTHDIRTPLTGLLGYLELMGKEEEDLTETQRDQLRLCIRKAEQIKGLTDNLFLYFWAYNQAESEKSIETEPLACGLLMEQLIGDYIPALEAAGLTLEYDLTAIRPEDEVHVSAEYLRRVTDNLFDNIVKYASPDHPVRVTAEREEGYIRIRFENTIGSPRETAAGTRVGVKSCVNMMRMMGGSLKTEEREGRFWAEVRVRRE